MHTNTVLSTLLFTLASTTAAQDVNIDTSDIPQPCQSICAPVVALTVQCDQNTLTGSAERDCVCNASISPIQIPLCAACVSRYDVTNSNDNDIFEILRACGYPSTTYNPSTALPTATATATSTTGSASPSSTAAATITTTTSTTSTGTPTTETGTPTTTTTDAAETATAEPSSTPAPSPTSGGADRVLGSGVGLVVAMLGVMGLI